MNQPRKGARSRSEIQPHILAAINRGEIEALTLSESLVVDFQKLMKHVFPKLKTAAKTIDPQAGIVKRMQHAGKILLQELGAKECENYVSHSSDTIRGWVAYALTYAPKLTLAARLKKFTKLANDAHSGVREWAWLALRPHVAEKVQAAIELLLPWSCSKERNIRRFSIEITRPRGVWCEHIAVLKTSPELGLPLLENVKADEHKYVQDSCANWLNDASKSDPQFVRQVTQRWRQESPEKSTLRICTRALRSIQKS